MTNSITKNTVLITLALIGQKVISFAYFAMVARYLGAEDTGKYYFTLSFTTIFVVFVDLGLTNVLVREAAKFKDQAQKYFSTILSTKVVLAVFSYLGVIVAINLLHYPNEIKNLVYLSGVTMLFDSLHLSIYGVIRAFGNLKYESIGIISSQFITLILGTTFLYYKLPLIYLILAFTIPSFLNVCYASFVLFKKFNLFLKPQFDKVIFKYIAKIGIPFALAAIFARVYSYIDSVIISKMAGNIALGWYSIATKVTFAFQFIPLALTAALYPKFSEYFVTNKEKLSATFEKAVTYLLVIVFPIAIGIAILAKDIVISIFSPQYIHSILPLQILVVSLIFSFLSFPVGALLNACNRQNTQTTITFFVLLSNVILNLILIPKIGIIGSAISATFGNILLTLFGYFFVHKVTTVSNYNISKIFLTLLFCALVMGGVVGLVNYKFNFLIAIIGGAITYVGMLFLTKSVTREQIRDILHIF